MIRRYDMSKSDNYMKSGTSVFICGGTGEFNFITGFPVTSAIVSFATIPIGEDAVFSSSSSSMDSSSSSSIYSSSSSSSGDSSSSSSFDSSSTSEAIVVGLPKIYVKSYLSNGFVIKYENIPYEIGYIEFNYMCQ